MKVIWRRPIRISLMVTVLLTALTLAAAGQDASPQPDNTKMNQRDRNSTEATADQQKENHSDREMAKQIRRAIIKDKGLSTYAHNVKVIVQDGVVSLKGPVRSEEEKKSVEEKATAVAGEGKVTNELDVKPEKSS